MRTTALRLERRRTDDAEQAANLLQQHYEELATALLHAGRQRGYLGGDPLGALASLQTMPPQDLAMLQQIGELWRAFFDSFRADEQAFEAARFQTDAADVNRRLEALPPGQAPDSELAMAMLDTLVVFWEERQEALSSRIDQLIDDLSQHQHRLGSADLQRAHQADELERSTGLVRAALQELGDELDGSEPLSALLAHLVRHWRGELHKRSQLLQQAQHEHQALLRALHTAASGRIVSDADLGETGRALVAQVIDMLAAHGEQEQTLKAQEQDRIKLLAELADKDQVIAKRDQLIARYEFGEAEGGDVDHRLQLYRQAIAAWETGTDPSAVVAQIHVLERVIILGTAERSRCLVLLDRHLEGLAKTLQGLRKLNPLIEDPKRFRPRLLTSSAYDLKRIRGLLQAGRDAGRDLQTYVERARWVAGCQLLAKELPRMRRVFKEMVGFIGDCREQVQAAPLSLATDLQTLSGLASLPASLAVDVKALLRSRGAKTVLPDVQKLLEECVQVFHDLVERARGERIPRQAVASRESTNKAVQRLADELADLAGLITASFAEAKDLEWQLPENETRLLNEEHVLLLGLRDLDAMVDSASSLKGAPAAELPPLPGGRRSDLGGLKQATDSRVRYLEDISRYRFERVDGGKKRG